MWFFFFQLKKKKSCNCFVLHFFIPGREFFVGLSKRTNQRGAEILADTFKVCKFIHATGNTSYHPLDQLKNYTGQDTCHTLKCFVYNFFLKNAEVNEKVWMSFKETDDEVRSEVRDHCIEVIWRVGGCYYLRAYWHVLNVLMYQHHVLNARPWRVFMYILFNYAF